MVWGEMLWIFNLLQWLSLLTSNLCLYIYTGTAQKLLICGSVVAVQTTDVKVSGSNSRKSLQKSLLRNKIKVNAVLKVNTQVGALTYYSYLQFNRSPLHSSVSRVFYRS